MHLGRAFYSQVPVLLAGGVARLREEVVGGGAWLAEVEEEEEEGWLSSSTSTSLGGAVRERVSEGEREWVRG